MLRRAAWVRRLPPAAPLLAGVGLLVLVAVLSATGESAVEVGQGWIPRFNRPIDNSDELQEVPRSDEYDAPPVLRIAAALGLVVLLLAITLLALLGLVAIILGMHVDRRRRVKRQLGGPVEEADDDASSRVEVMRRAAGAALDRLLARAGGDPTDAVVAAWLALEESAAECGQARRPHQTPTEFTSAVLAGLHVDASALDELRLVYQRARFSGHRVTEEDVRTATEALRRVVADLATATERVPTGTGEPP